MTEKISENKDLYIKLIHCVRYLKKSELIKLELSSY
jgi:uncharacterized protein YjgD (DUF1641 family)